MGVGVPPPAYSCNNFSLVNPPPSLFRIKILNICRMFFLRARQDFGYFSSTFKNGATYYLLVEFRQDK